MTQEVSFSDAVFVPERALAYGFTEKGGTYRFEKLLCGGQFCLEVDVPPGGGLFTQCARAVRGRAGIPLAALSLQRRAPPAG